MLENENIKQFRGQTVREMSHANIYEIFQPYIRQRLADIFHVSTDNLSTSLHPLSGDALSSSAAILRIKYALGPNTAPAVVGALNSELYQLDRTMVRYEPTLGAYVDGPLLNTVCATFDLADKQRFLDKLNNNEDVILYAINNSDIIFKFRTGMTFKEICKNSLS